MLTPLPCFSHHEQWACACLCVYKTRPLEKGKNMPLLKSIVCMTRNWVGWDGEHSCYAVYWVELDRRSCSHEHPDVVGADTGAFILPHAAASPVHLCSQGPGPEPSLYRGELLFHGTWILTFYTFASCFCPTPCITAPCTITTI